MGIHGSHEVGRYGKASGLKTNNDSVVAGRGARVMVKQIGCRLGPGIQKLYIYIYIFNCVILYGI